MYSQNQHTKRNTIILVIVCAIIFFGVIGYSIYQTIYRSDKVKVGVYYAPFVAQVKIDDIIVKNNSTTWLTLGEHNILVSYDGFDDFTATAEITDETGNIYGALTPNTPAGEQIMQTYKNDYDFIGSLSSASSVLLGEQNRQKWPIITYLPITNTLFSLGYSISADNHLTININADTTYLDNAVDTLKKYATADAPIAQYDIIFTQWNNPLQNLFTSNNSSDAKEYLTQGYRSTNPDLNLTINTGKYSQDNQYYYTTITTGYEERYNLIIYRAILTHQGESWRLIATPQPIATTYNTTDTPIDILTAANNL